MSTGLDLVTAALKDIGAIAVGETPTADEANDALIALNSMIGSWNNDRLMVYNIEENIFNYTPFQRVYTVGPGGNFNMARPVKIISIKNRANNGSTNQIDLDITLTENAATYADLVVKNVQSNLTLFVYNDNSYPLLNLDFWPVPRDTSYRPVIYSWRAVAEFATLTTQVSTPPGYYRALQKNLAIELCPAYGRDPSATLEKHALEALNAIKRNNTPERILKIDGTVPGTRRVNDYGDFLSGIA